MRSLLIGFSILLAACSGQDAATADGPAASRPSPTPSRRKDRTPASTRPIIDVPKLAGLSRDDVGLVIGPPVSCEDVKEGTKCIYDQIATEIVFIDGKADWITVSRLGNARFEEATLTRLGIQTARPSFSSDAVMRWSEHDGLLEVSLFPGHGDSVDYVLVKARTP